MKRKTNMKKVLAAVKKYFDMEVSLTARPDGYEDVEHPLLLLHDFCRHAPSVPGRQSKPSDVLESPERLQRLRDEKWALLREMSAAELITSADYRYRFRLLRDTADFLSAGDLSAVLRAIWPDEVGLEPSASGECTKEEAVAWFRACDPEEVMPPLDAMLLKRLPDIITVYRSKTGLSGLAPADAVSWTLNPVMAMMHPEDSRFGAFYSEGGYQASIKAEDVLAYFYRHDMEIVLDPDKLFDIRPIYTMGELLSDNDVYDVITDQRYWYGEYYNAEVRRRLVEKLEPAGRVNEFIEAAADTRKFDRLVSEFSLDRELIL